MTNDEIISKDFQILTYKMLSHNSALLRTILQNQMSIMKALNMKNATSADINKKVNKNVVLMEDFYKDTIPAYKDITPPLKD